MDQAKHGAFRHRFPDRFSMHSCIFCCFLLLIRCGKHRASRRGKRSHNSSSMQKNLEIKEKTSSFFPPLQFRPGERVTGRRLKLPAAIPPVLFLSSGQSGSGGGGEPGNRCVDVYRVDKSLFMPRVRSPSRSLVELRSPVAPLGLLRRISCVQACSDGGIFGEAAARLFCSLYFGSSSCVEVPSAGGSDVVISMDTSTIPGG
jgi:hypothetical protein